MINNRHRVLKYTTLRQQPLQSCLHMEATNIISPAQAARTTALAMRCIMRAEDQVNVMVRARVLAGEATCHFPPFQLCYIFLFVNCYIYVENNL